MENQLIKAAVKGDKTQVALLLKSNRDIINAKDKDGDTALICAAEYGHKEVVDSLLRMKPDINAKGKDGDTALICAAYKGHTEVVNSLLRMKPDINAKDKNGDTALIYAAANGHKEVVDALLKNGADINVQNNTGGTALVWAARKGKKEVVERLLQYDPDIAKGAAGMKAVDYTKNPHLRMQLLQVSSKGVTSRQDSCGTQRDLGYYGEPGAGL